MSYAHSHTKSGAVFYYKIDSSGKKKRVPADQVPASVKKSSKPQKPVACTPQKVAAKKPATKPKKAATRKPVVKKTATKPKKVVAKPKKTVAKKASAKPKKTATKKTVAKKAPSRAKKAKAVTTRNVEYVPAKSKFDPAYVNKMFVKYNKLIETTPLDEFRALVATLKNNIVNSNALTEEQRNRYSKKASDLQERKRKMDAKALKAAEHSTRGCGDVVYETRNWGPEHKTRGCGMVEHSTRHHDMAYGTRAAHWGDTAHAMRGMCGA